MLIAVIYVMLIMNLISLFGMKQALSIDLNMNRH